MYEQLRRVITDSGIWAGDRLRTHRFLLSPSVFTISKDQHEELERLGWAIRECQLGLSHIATIAHDMKLNYRHGWMTVRRVCCAGVPKQYYRYQERDIRSIPSLLKVDLILGSNGRFIIGEIDGHNKHGVGYSSLCAQLRTVACSDKKPLPGVISLLAHEVKRLGKGRLKLLYGDQERFYLPEFEIAKTQLEKHGVGCVVVSETDANPSLVSEGLFLDLPFMYHREGLYEVISAGVDQGDVQFIIPPKPFLGSKGVLALIRNDAHDIHLESILHAFINEQSLALVRSYIPKTFLVGKDAMDRESVSKMASEGRYVLKEAISSGMKGVFFSGETDFEEALSIASTSKNHWVLQEEVINQPQTFSWFDGDQQLRSASDWLMRVTVQYVRRDLGDIIVTARRNNKAVHGGKDAIMIGTVLA